ncbi:MAG: tetratricopeptide repeat protein [Bacteroidetes bacterium]|nr:tetratricopeptide repeat protein [Bacteroidota bacterium]
MALGLLLGLRFLGDEAIHFSNIGLNLLLLLVSAKLAVFLHEWGHLLFAKLAGGTPRRMVLGRGSEIARTEWLGVKIILARNFNLGLAYAGFDDSKRLHFKLACYYAGGFILNFSLAFALYSSLDLEFTFAEGLYLESSFFLANVITGVSALFPYRLSYQGQKVNSDGLSLVRLPFRTKEELMALTAANDFLDALDYFEEKQYSKCLVIYERYQAKNPKNKFINLNLALVHMKLGDVPKAIGLLEELIPLAGDSAYAHLKLPFYNALAWIYLLKDQIELADQYSKMAFDLSDENEAVKNTRGSVLIEKGELEEGLALLKGSVNFKLANDDSLAASIYLALAYHKLGEPKKTKQYNLFIEENRELLDWDLQFLYKRVKQQLALAPRS